MMRSALLQSSILRRLRGTVAACGLILALTPVMSSANDFCPNVYDTGVFNLDFNPAFLHIDEFDADDGEIYDGLIVTSFFNAIKDNTGARIGYFERDLVARIEGIGYRSPAWFKADRDVEVISDQDLASPVIPRAQGQTIWPNEAQRVPDGVLPFEAIVVPEGFHVTFEPGRLTLIDLDDPNRQTYLIHQSLQEGDGRCKLPSHSKFDPLVQPRFYHIVKWFDMDNDGLRDAVTVRSGFKVQGKVCLDAAGEVVWFKNPGAGIDPNVEWEENIVVGYPTDPYGADISMDIFDFEGDGVPEIVGTNFFNGSAISIYGAPVGDTWADVDPTTNPARNTQINTGNGEPFNVRIVDLNGDGSMDVLATNHQGDNCFAGITLDPNPGRVYAIEQPASGDLFNDPWPEHILKDNIRPNPTYPTPASGPGRLGPGLAQPFWFSAVKEAQGRKPWILVGGDEASKVWVLKPNSEDANDWNYLSSVIFDINDYYGANTTQSFTAPAPSGGTSISTIGQPDWRYDRGWAWASYAEVYIPVFEGRAIHRISFRPRPDGTGQIVCPADGALACPVTP